MSAFDLRPVDFERDAELLFQIYASTRDAEMAMVDWDADQIEAFLQMQYRAQEMHYGATYPDADRSVIIVDGTGVGGLWIDRRADEVRVVDIAILAEHRNKGLATEILRSLQAEAAELGVPLRESVFAGNLGAIALYQRLGFRQIGEAGGAHLAMEWRPATAG